MTDITLKNNFFLGSPNHSDLPLTIIMTNDS